MKGAGKGDGAVTKIVVIAFRYCSAELAEVGKISLEKEQTGKEKSREDSNSK